ncbi:SGNH/GDSL hydrolase family protein [Candidatus Pelagibacter sp.]|nr:SGNH/GDSL hydrolase family protein [Candidatus Pelagibacter sp.]
MKFKNFFIYTLITGLIFVGTELISWKILHEYYKKIAVDGNITLKNINKFSLFSIKEIFNQDLELSTYYSFRYKSNHVTKGEVNKIQTVYKGLLDEKYNNSKNRPPLKDNNTYDIYFFGGSTAFTKNSGESLGKFINNFLIESECSKKYNFRVITAGNSGYATINQVNRLVSDIIYLKPEHVVFFDGINDFLHSHNSMNWEINDTIHQNKYRKLFLKVSEGKLHFKEFFLTLPGRFYSITLFEKTLKKILGINIMPDKVERELIEELNKRVLIAERNKFNEKGIINYIQNHKILDALGIEFEFKTIHIFQPTLSYDIHQKISGFDKIDYEDYFPDVRNNLDKNKKKIVSNFYYENSIKFYKAIEDKFEDLNKVSDNKYISYANIFKNQRDISKIYYDFVHYNDYFAINVISKKISSDILKTLNCS